MQSVNIYADKPEGKRLANGVRVNLWVGRAR